jgi:hypothetical protein
VLHSDIHAIDMDDLYIIVRDITSLTPHVGRIIYFPCNKGQY